MPPKRRIHASKQKSAKKLKLNLRKAVLDQDCAQLAKATDKNKGRKPYGHVAKLINDMKNDYPWKTRHTVNCAFKLYERESSKEKNASSVDSTSVEEQSDAGSRSASRNKGGHPKGSTDNAKFERGETIRLAQDSTPALDSFLMLIDDFSVTCFFLLLFLVALSASSCLL